MNYKLRVILCLESIIFYILRGDVAVSLFTKVLIPDENVIPAWEQPDSTNAYMIGDKVSHNGKTWVSNVNNNVWEPSVYGWDEV